MIIRKATSEDIPAIVQLLKSSLGDISSIKSVEYWNWKHVVNPFGASPVLVAEENGMLIGVRALMRWDWKENETIYRTLRAVDTATHPQHQGKGIFKKLTLKLVDDATADGFDFIFNSPNSQSTPGYLKMGWKVWGKMPLWMRPVLSLKKYQPDVFHKYHQNLLNTNLHALPVLQSYETGLSTVLSPAFFTWRYQQCPVKEYGLYSDERLYFFFTTKEKKGGMEFRVCHYVFTEKADYNKLFSAAKRLANECGCRYITITGLHFVPWYAKLLHGFINAKRFSITLTIKKLANYHYYESLKGKKNWLLQNGDIELF